MKPWFAWPSELRRAGVLGMNERNLEFIAKENKRSLFPLVDDKVLTKKICEQNGIPCPATYGVIESYGEISNFAKLVTSKKEFVVKPARGSGGRGVLVFKDRADDGYISFDGTLVPRNELHYHLASILSGLYSLGGQPDKVIIEERVVKHSIFENVAIGGTPDIRIIAYRHNPVMGMLRLPTKMSKGRANLHQGAVGVGIEMEKGWTSGGVWRDGAISHHPDTGFPVAGLRVPHWNEICEIAMRLSAALELGYIGIDLVLDVNRGPVVLEANGRPGLAIQIANRQGLWLKLKDLNEERI
jgi:alpha-L-glutamate ligase-like protein